MEAVGLAASLASLVQIAASIAKLTYTYGVEVVNARETQKLYVQEVSAFISVLLRSQQALLDSEASGLTHKRPISLSDDIVHSCHGELKALEGDLLKRTNRLMWPFLERDLRKHIDALARFRQIFSDYLSSVILDSSVVAYKKLQHVAFEQERQQLLMLLGNVEGSRAKPDACPGTGLWILHSEEFKAWRDRQGGLLWCFGAPGVGKSLLASIIIDHLRERQEPMQSSVACYFCEFSSRERQSPLVILQSMLRQLVEQAGEDVVMTMKTVISDPIKRAKEEDLCKILAQVCSLHPSYLIIDAPDELDQPRRLLSYIQLLVDGKARVLITSRDIPEMKRFAKLTKIEAKSEREDIRTYLKEQFKHHELLEDEGDMESDRLINSIVPKSGNLFLLAKLIADNILEQQTLRQMRKVAETFPDSLEAAYDATLTRIDAQPKARKALARRLLAWITRSMRRLRLQEIVEAFAVEEDADEIDGDNKLDTGRLLSSCCGILTVNKDDRTVGFIHTTAHEFFEKVSSDADANADIAGTCLLYLNLRPFRTEVFSSAQEQSRKLKSMPFLAYAASSWGYHVKTREIETGLQSRIMMLLRHRCARSNAFQALNFPEHLPEDLAESVFSFIPTGQEPLHISAFWDLHGTTLQLLQEGADASPPDSQNWTPLHWACSWGHLEVAAILIRHHAEVDAIDSQGWTPLFWAAFSGHPELVCLLLEHGANHLHRSALGWTALHWAISKRHHAVVEAILKHHGSSIWTKTRPSRLLRNLSYQDVVCLPVNPVEIAASIGDTKIFDALTTCVETSRSISDDLSFNAIWSAEKFDHPIANPWRTQLKGEGGNNPLSRYLVNPLGSEWDYGTTDTEKAKDTKEWKSKLVLSAIKDKKMDIARILIHCGADVNYYNDEATPLHAAVLCREPDFCRQLIQMGANPERVDARGLTPLHHAVLNGDTDVVLALLQSGSDANTRATKPANYLYSHPYSRWGANSRTPLILLCGFLSDDDEPREELALQLAVLLTEYGADVNMPDREGRTALHYAVVNPYIPLIECLLGAGARSDLEDADGWTSFHDFAAAADFDIEHGDEWLRRLISRLLESASDQNAHRIFNLEAQGKKSYRYQLKRSQKRGFADINAAPKPAATPVTLALDNAQWATFKVFRELGGRIPPSQDHGHALHQAVQDMEPDMVATLLDHGAVPQGDIILTLVKSLASSLNNGKSDSAVTERFLSVLMSVKSAKVDFNIHETTPDRTRFPSEDYSEDEDECKQEGGMTALQMAARDVDDEEITKALLQSGASPTLASADSFNSVVISAVHARTASLGVLVRHLDPKPELPRGSSDYEKLCWHLRKGGKINATTRRGKTVLHLAAGTGNHELVSCLLKYGADAYAADKCCLMPAHHAALVGSLETLKLLYPLEGGPGESKRRQVDLDIPAWWDHPILYVAVKERHADMAQYLLQLGAETARKDEQPDICVAAQKGYDDMVAALLDSGVGADSPDPDGWTALHYAAHDGSEAVTRTLLSRGASVSATTTCWGSGGADGRWMLSRIRRATPWAAQPLHVAAISGHPGVVKLLLQHGADVNASTGTDDYGPTALHMALDPGRIGLRDEGFCKVYLEVARSLVEAGANVSGVADRFTVQHVLMFNGFEDLWDKLRAGITQ